MQRSCNGHDVLLDAHLVFLEQGVVGGQDNAAIALNGSTQTTKRDLSAHRLLVRCFLNIDERHCINDLDYISTISFW